MNISREEQEAIRATLQAGARFGYGNLISHLQTAWAKMLIDEYGLSETTARKAALGPGYPFEMQKDLIERGEWDETGKRYREAKRDL